MLLDLSEDFAHGESIHTVKVFHYGVTRKTSDCQDVDKGLSNKQLGIPTAIKTSVLRTELLLQNDWHCFELCDDRPPSG